MKKHALLLTQRTREPFCLHKVDVRTPPHLLLPTTSATCRAVIGREIAEQGVLLGSPLCSSQLSFFSRCCGSSPRGQAWQASLLQPPTARDMPRATAASNLSTVVRGSELTSQTRGRHSLSPGHDRAYSHKQRIQSKHHQRVGSVTYTVESQCTSPILLVKHTFNI